MQLCSFCISAFTGQLVHFMDLIGEKVIPRGYPIADVIAIVRKLWLILPPSDKFSQLSFKGK
jgi:hypothetical protein